MEKQTSHKSLALGISIAFHLVLLSVFAIVKLSGPAPQRAVPQGSIRQMASLADAEPVTPKPKINRVFAVEGTAKSWKLPLDEISMPRPDSNFTQTAGTTSASRQGTTFGTSGFRSHTIQFFGNSTNQRKICFVVDSSGSMKGLFGQAQKQLEKSISELEPDQFFAIVFFGGSRLVEFEKGQLVRATAFKKQKAVDFIRSVKPAGQTDAIVALQKAMTLRDASGEGPGTIYLLTDAFELDPKGAKGFCDKVLKIRRQLAPQCSIHPIMFWPQPADKEIISTLASQTAGRYTAME